MIYHAFSLYQFIRKLHLNVQKKIGQKTRHS